MESFLNVTEERISIDETGDNSGVVRLGVVFVRLLREAPSLIPDNQVCRIEAMTGLHPRLHSVTIYSGHARRHDYAVTVSHSPWRTKVLALTIDGVEHLHEADSTKLDANGVEARIRGWFTVRIVVRRPTVEGKMVDREEVHVTSSALGGAGEAEIHSGDDIAPLLPQVGSRSEARDLKRTAHPTAFALITGLTTILRLSIPLLGLGALLSFLTEPVKAWLSRHLTPILEPIFDWLGQLLQPLGQALLAIGRFFGEVIDFLFGWLPAIHLPFDIPDWIWTTAKIALLALIAFSVSQANLKRRKRLLEEASAGVDDDSQ